MAKSASLPRYLSMNENCSNNGPLAKGHRPDVNGPLAKGPRPVRSHRDLTVWQKAMDLTVDVYRLTKRFPPDELYALVSQLRRSAASIPANIAEGRGRSTERDFAHFVSVARGSAMEVDTFLRLALRLEYLTDVQVKPVLVLVAEIANMLSSLRMKLQA